MWSIFLGAVLGLLTSLGVAIAVENWRRPRLALSIETPPHDASYPDTSPARGVRTLRIRVLNKPLPSFWKWMVRAPALQCRATVTFHHLDRQNVFGRTMDGRWSSSRQPVPLPVVGSDGQQYVIVDYERMSLRSQIDIYPGETELLDIAVKLEDDQECYGWNNEAYFSTPLWETPVGDWLMVDTSCEL
jgi:hypothetical protein